MSARIHVIGYLDGWGVRHNDLYQGPYFTRELALSVAYAQVHRLQAKGCDARVIVQPSPADEIPADVEKKNAGTHRTASSGCYSSNPPIGWSSRWV
jgi:hypothetical protein